MLEAQIREMEAKRQVYKEQLEQLDVDGRELTSQWVDREMLAERVGALEVEVQFLADRINAREIEHQNTPTRVELVRAATIPKTPDTDNRIKMSGMAGMGLFGLSVVLIVWQEHVRRKVNTTGELHHSIGLPLLATVPVIPRSISNAGKKSDSRAAFWHNVLTESFDSARAPCCSAMPI